MVGRFYIPVSCFGYAQGAVHEYPVLRVKLFNLAGEELARARTRASKARSF